MLGTYTLSHMGLNILHFFIIDFPQDLTKGDITIPVSPIKKPHKRNLPNITYLLKGRAWIQF